MAKQEIKQRETQVETGDGVGKQLEQTLTIDDNSLPSAQELAAYKSIDPKIVDYLISTSIKEQEHRHKMDTAKINIVKSSDSRDDRMNWWGMFFAFWAIVVLMLLAAYALYLNRPWFAGALSIGALSTIGGIFIKRKG